MKLALILVSLLAIVFAVLVILMALKIRRLQRDALTGLLDRRSAGKWFEQRHSSRGGLGVIYCDLNQFNQINNQYGHHVGDECLKEVASALMSVCKRSTDHVYRWGGDEFVIFIENPNQESMDILVKRIKEKVALIELSVPIKVSASVGVAIQDDQMVPLESVIKKADELMYTDKGLFHRE